MLNNTTLTGRIANDLELRYTGSGIAVLQFRLAVDRSYTNAQGERETDFISCVVWRKTAETMAAHLSKGSLIGLVGSIQTRNYQHAQGHTVYVTEVVVDNFTFLESKKTADSNRQQAGNANTQVNQQNTTAGNFGGNAGTFAGGDVFDDTLSINDDDLPF